MTETIGRLSSSLGDRYRLERELGQGGMATVYLAHDVRHDRKVALKVLRPELAAILGGARFLAEIKTTANLQHPHILSLFDSGEADGLVYYVMPYVDGESLRDRITREKQLPVEDAVRIAREVADALEYAHQHGIVHRDIKPENILLHGGHAMVADFGIALAASRSDGGTRMTETGMSLGTPHYMAPEQAMGEREITPKADIYALGCVLYEMLSGEPPFNGPTAQAIVARVMTERPRSLTIQRHTIPAHVEDAVDRALEKLPADRFATAAEFAKALEDGRTVGRSDGREASSQRRESTIRPSSRPTALIAAAWILVGAALAIGGRRLAQAPAEPLALQVVPPADHPLGAPSASNVALSPDGKTIAFIARGQNGRQVFLRKLGSFETTPVAGTDGAFGDVVFSPDGKSLAYVHEDYSINRVLAAGGQKITITPVEQCCTLEWTDRGILYTTPHGLELAPPGGGAARVLLHLDKPAVAALLLPNDDILFVNPINARFVQVVRKGDSTPVRVAGLPDNVDDVAWVDGWLLLTIANEVRAFPFNARTHAVGDGSVLIPDVRVGASGGFRESQLAVTSDAIAFVPASGNNRIAMVDRAGRATVFSDTTGVFHRPRFGPGGLLSLDITHAQGRDVWVYDPAQRTMSRVSFETNGHDAIWMPDGRTLMYIADGKGGDHLLLRRRPDGSVPMDTFAVSGQIDAPEAVLPDGRVLAYSIASRNSFLASNAWMFDRTGRTHVEPLPGDFDKAGFAISRDGRWLLYASGESGRSEVYLRAVDGGARLQVSEAGGREPRFGTGNEVFYRAPGAGGARLMSARVSLAPMHVLERDTLFSVADYEEADPHANYDVSADGRQFVFIKQLMPNEIRVIRNWKALLQSR